MGYQALTNLTGLLQKQIDRRRIIEEEKALEEARKAAEKAKKAQEKAKEIEAPKTSIPDFTTLKDKQGNTWKKVVSKPKPAENKPGQFPIGEEKGGVSYERVETPEEEQQNKDYFKSRNDYWESQRDPDTKLRENIERNKEEIRFKAETPPLVQPEKGPTLAEIQPEKQEDSLVGRLKTRIDNLKRDPNESLKNTGKAISEFVAPYRNKEGFDVTEEEKKAIDESKPTFKEKIIGASKVPGNIAYNILETGANLLFPKSEGQLKLEEEAKNKPEVAERERIFKEGINPQTPGEAKAMRYTDAALAVPTATSKGIVNPRTAKLVEEAYRSKLGPKIIQKIIQYEGNIEKLAAEIGDDTIVTKLLSLGDNISNKSQPLQEGVSGLPKTERTPQLPKTESQFPTTTKGSGIKPPALDKSGTPEEISYYKKFINWKRGKTAPLREVIEDEWIRVKNLERSGADVSQNLTPYEAHKLFPGRIAARSKMVQEEVSRIDKDILQTGKKFKAENLSEEVNQYLIAKHAPERNAIHGERAAGMSDDEAQQILSNISKSPHGKEVERIAKEVQTLNKTTLEVLYDGQVIDKETYDLLNTTYKNHVPLQRVMENDDIVQVLTGKGLSVKGSGIKRAVGSEREVKDILGNVSANLQEALVRAEKNRVNLSTLEFARNNENTGLFEIFKPKAIGRTFDDKIITEKITDPLVLTVRENGKPVHIRIKDPKLAVVYQGLGVQKMPPFLNFVGSFTRLYSGIHTRFNYEFALSNKIRDIQEMATYISSQKGMGIRGAGKAVGRDIVSMAEVTGNSKLYQQMVMDGGTTGGMALSTRQAVELDIENIRKLNRSTPRKAAELVMRGVDKWNTIFEDSTRLSVYKTALGNGLSREKAAILAKDATIDFNKKGTGGAVINAIWMFSNASIQGTSKMLGALKNPKTAATVVTAVGGATWTVNSWNDKLDPDWRSKVTKWDRNNNLIIVLPTNEGTRYVTIPVSWGLKPLKVSADYAYDLANGKDAGVVKSIENLIGSAMDAYNPVGGTDAVSAATPTILDMPVDIARNRSWSGANIKPDWMQGLPKADQYFQSLKNSAVGRTAISATQSISEKTGRAIDISPEDAVYVYEQMIGGAGKSLTRLFNTAVGIAKGEDVMPRNVPFLNRFYKTRTPEELQSSQKWEDKEELQQGFRQFKTGSPEQKDAIQKHILSLPKEERQKEAFILREEGFDLEGVTQSENVYNFRPKAEQLKKNLSEGNMKEFYDTIDGLSPEEQATFGDIKTSNPEFKGFSPYTKYDDPVKQKAENTRTFKERLFSNPEEGIRFFNKLDAAEQKRIKGNMDNKGNEEWFKKYQEATQKTSLLNKALGVKTAEAKTIMFNQKKYEVKPNLATVDLNLPKTIAKENGAPEQYAEIIGKSAQENGVPEDIFTRMLKQESAFKEEIIRGSVASSAGAQGIAQFMPATAKERGIDPLNPDEAIPAAAKYLKELYDEFGDWKLALAAYNAGPGNVRKYGGIPPFPETQKYVETIIGSSAQNSITNVSAGTTVFGKPNVVAEPAYTVLGKRLRNARQAQFERDNDNLTRTQFNKKWMSKII